MINNRKISIIKILLLIPVFLMTINGCAEKPVKTRTGLEYIDLVKGEGKAANWGETVVVNYKGTLADGTEIDNSYTANKPLVFIPGKGTVIKGLEEGVIGMKVGGKRKITIPPDLGYGPEGAGSRIPGNSFLIFEVQLLEVK